jgi:predicted metal-dependent hydrolase
MGKKKKIVSTKQCPDCGSEHLGLIRSQFIKYCTECNLWFDWPLEENQEVLK